MGRLQLCAQTVVDQWKNTVLHTLWPMIFFSFGKMLKNSSGWGDCSYVLRLWWPSGRIQFQNRKFGSSVIGSGSPRRERFLGRGNRERDGQMGSNQRPEISGCFVRHGLNEV
ncbi:hypothetical protein AVEN_189946-1 [Araneus ventricosus]|uniref:Uncharacterized protein n=1 Tax=Araneus ventricosus TaxID=182803 RepID=A0A4Y2F501_ARAVE|nr:hypothetical protein AVEN_189946-1 [Araneus ventricosus]